MASGFASRWTWGTRSTGQRFSGAKSNHMLERQEYLGAMRDALSGIESARGTLDGNSVDGRAQSRQIDGQVIVVQHSQPPPTTYANLADCSRNSLHGLGGWALHRAMAAPRHLANCIPSLRAEMMPVPEKKAASAVAGSRPRT